MNTLLLNSFARTTALLGFTALAGPGCALSPQTPKGVEDQRGEPLRESSQRLAEEITDDSQSLIEQTWCFASDEPRNDRFIAETPCSGIRDNNRNGKLDLLWDSLAIDCLRRNDEIVVPAARASASITHSYPYLWAECLEETPMTQADLVLLGLDPARAVGQSLETLFTKTR